jgi:ectoine hydroxylase-related dioxygenase (phytanoyl-CoA dioxygenase family)
VDDTSQQSTALYSHFRRAGFARAVDSVDVNLVTQMREIILRDLQEKREPFRTDMGGNPVRLDALSRRSPIFLQVLRNSAVSNLLRTLLGPNIVLLRNRHNHATLNRQGDIPFRLHRDILQWSRGIITLIIYLEEATAERGCTHVVPGSHLERFAGIPPDGGGGNWADDHVEYQHLLAQAVPVPMESGGVLAIDSLTFHSVGINVTDSSRMSVTFALRSVDELEQESDRHDLLLGQWIYKGNDLDYNTVIPAQNARQANV